MNAETLNPLSTTTATKAYPNPDDPQPPGPWDPYIRQAIEKVFGPFPEPWRAPFESVFGPFPQPWRMRFETANERLRNLARVKPEVWDVIGSGDWEKVALNPQPLPPRWAVALEFVRVVAERLVMIQETADVINNGGDRGIIVVGGKMSELVDFVCGNNFPRKIPPPSPDPRLTGLELVLMGAEVISFSKSLANEALGAEFASVGKKLIDAGLERIG